MVLRRVVSVVGAGALAAAGVVTAGAALAPAAQAVGSGTAATVVADVHGAPAGAPYRRGGAYDATDSAVLVEQEVDGGVGVTLTPRDGSGAMQLQLYPASGQRLHAGYYADVPSGSGGQALPTLSLTFGSQAESFDAADVDVRDWATDSRGVPTRFDVLFRETPGAVGGLYGEVRMGEPATAGQSDSSAAVLFPQTVAGGAPVTATERVRNTSAGAERVGRLAVGGADARSFTLSADTCSGRTLARGATCTAAVSSTPTAAGPRTATLSVPVGGGTAVVPLDGAVAAGTTRQTTSGDDYVDGGRTWDYVDGRDQLTERTDLGGQRWTFTPHDLSGADAQPITVELSAPSGQRISDGTHTVPSEIDDSAWTMRVGGEGRGCNDEAGTVTLSGVSTDAAGDPLHAGITFSLTCFGGPAGDHPITGRVQWRTGSDTTGPGAVRGVSVAGSAGSRLLSWRNPTAADYARTLVRVLPGTAVAGVPGSGAPVTSAATSAALRGLTRGAQYTATLFTVDTTGNVSAAGHVTFTG